MARPKDKAKVLKVLSGAHDQNVQTPEYIMDFLRGVKSTSVYNAFATHFELELNLNLNSCGDSSELEPYNAILDFVPSNYSIDILEPDFNWYEHYCTMCKEYDTARRIGTWSPPITGSYIVYINPPYGSIDKFIIKANDELARVPAGKEMPLVFLFPLRADTAGFHRHVLGDNSKCFLVSPVNGRIKFKGHKNGLYGSIAFLFFGNGKRNPMGDPAFKSVYTTPERTTYIEKNDSKLKRKRE